MKHIACVLATCALLLAPRPAADEIAFAPGAGSEVEKTFESLLDAELEELRRTVNGQEVQIDLDELGEAGMEMRQRYVVTDRYAEVGEGRPIRLERTFDELENRMTGGPGGPEAEAVEESELEGLAVVFTWDEEEEEYTVSFAGDDGDTDLLEGLEEDMDLRTLLPDGPVEEGGSWEIEPSTFHRLLDPGGDLHLEGEEEEESEDWEEIDEEMDENVSGSARATYAGRREEDGLELAVIHLEAEIETEGDAQSEIEAATAEHGVRLELEMEGELLWDVAAGRFHSLELQGRASISFIIRSDFEHEGETMEFEQEMTFAGPASFTFRAKALE